MGDFSNSKPFPATVKRHDPYKTFRFRIKIGTFEVAGFSKVTGLKRTTKVIDYKEAGSAIVRKGLGRTEYAEITLERGLTHDKDFEKWANAVQVLDSGDIASSNPKEQRKDLQIQLCDEAGNPVYNYQVFNCWIMEYQALPDLDAGGDAVAIETIKLAHEGWRRDTEFESQEA